MKIFINEGDLVMKEGNLVPSLFPLNTRFKLVAPCAFILFIVGLVLSFKFSIFDIIFLVLIFFTWLCLFMLYANFRYRLYSKLKKRFEYIEDLLYENTKYSDLKDVIIETEIYYGKVKPLLYNFEIYCLNSLQDSIYQMIEER